MVGLILIFAAVISDPTDFLAKTGIFFKACKGPSFAIFIIFLLSGMVIETHQIKSGIRDMKATFTALAVIFLVAPATTALLSLMPIDTGILLGLCIVAVMPTTLSSGVVMTATAGGNMAHALFITILSNFIAIGSIPLVLPLLLSGLNQDTVLAIDKGAIFFKLICLVLIPLVLGMGLKAKWLDIPTTTKKKLSIANQSLILFIVFMSLGSAKSVFLTMGGDMGTILVLVSGFHLVLLAAAALLIRIMGIRKGRFESVLFMGAQKTMPLAVMIQVTYFSQYGAALLVCVLHHIIHLIMDAYICQRLKP